MDLDEAPDEQPQLTLTSTSDLCQTLTERYAKSTAPQHRHLCASAAAMKSILEEENLPFTPPAYFAATISAINDASDSLDSDAISALSSFLSIVLPLLPSDSLPSSKAMDAVSVLVELLVKRSESLSAPALRSVIKSVEILIQFCDLEDWNLVKLTFETVLRFSIDKRPKVRRFAHTCIQKVFQSLHSPVGIKEASKVLWTFFNNSMPLEIEFGGGRAVDGSENKSVLKPTHMEFVHMLNSLKLVVPYLSKNVSLKILSHLYKLVTCHFSPLTRHIFDVLEVFFESARAEVIVPEAENIIASLVSYISAGQKNPMDTLISASILLKHVLGTLHDSNPSISMRNFPVVFRSIAGLLVFEPNASQAAGILKGLIYKHMDVKTVPASDNQVSNENIIDAAGMNSTCAVFENILSIDNGVSSEHTLAVISDMFLHLGELSHHFMKDILLKLADLIILANEDTAARKHLEECIGSAVIAMGPEKILALLPISFSEEKLVCSNIWLVPILKKNVVGASLEYYMNHVLPLVEALQQACRKVKKSSQRKVLQKCICALSGLLPAFCRYPTDTFKSFKHLAEVFTVYLKADSYMHENIALALQELVNQNRSILESTQTASVSVKHSADDVAESAMVFRSVPSRYSRKFAMKNIKALASCSADLLPSLIDLFFNSPPERRTYLKEAIGCLASITESSEVKRFFITALEKFKFTNEVGDSEKLKTSTNKDQEGSADNQKQDESRRSVILEFASSLVKGADKDLVDTIFDYIRSALQVTTAVGQSEAYYTLSKIFQEHGWFCSSRLDDILEFLLGVGSPVNIISLRSRFACFHTLLVFILKSDLVERREKAFLILNEIIIAVKDSNEESRKAAYDVLLDLSSSLMDSPTASSESSHLLLCNMIIGYLSGAPPPIMSGAVAALSLLIYKNCDICVSVPELVPSVLDLLQSKANEVIKAVLGFVKVLVSGLQASDLQELLADILSGILPWSSISRNHFRSKITVILEIIIRKCGSSSVESHIPGKYRVFFKNVKEQRHGKTQSKDATNSFTEPKTIVEPSKGTKKRTHNVMDSEASNAVQRMLNKNCKFANYHKSTDIEGRGSKMEQARKQPRLNTSDGRSDISIKESKRKNMSKNPHGGKKKMGHEEVKRKMKTQIHKPASISKFHKHKKPVQRTRSTNK